MEEIYYRAVWLVWGWYEGDDDEDEDDADGGAAAAANDEDEDEDEDDDDDNYDDDDVDDHDDDDDEDDDYGGGGDDDEDHGHLMMMYICMWHYLPNPLCIKSFPPPQVHLLRGFTPLRGCKLTPGVACTTQKNWCMDGTNDFCMTWAMELIGAWSRWSADHVRDTNGS